MPILAMSVESEENHPNANALRIYTFGAPGHDSIRVIANLENIYEVGDVVAVALVGSILKDGTRIKRASLRGIESWGMALGRVEANIGDDLTEEFGSHETKESTMSRDGFTFVKWTSIQQLPNIRLGLEKDKERLGEDFVYPSVQYKAKVKLDGTNAGVQLLADGRFVAQSRSRLLTPSDDNYQFASWVSENEEYFRQLAQSLGPAIVFGEWCGQGIQKKVAISSIGRRIFAVFAIQYGDHQTSQATIDIEPARLREKLPEHDEIFVLPWYKEPVTIHFGDKESLEHATTILNDWVEAVEETDPWVQETFGEAGTGEGLVLYPFQEEAFQQPILRDPCTSMMFKAKGEKHRVVRQKKAVQIDPEVAQSISDFVAMFVTEARLEQAISETCDGPLEMKDMAGFLRWMGQDVRKESDAELEASGLGWKQVGKPVTQAAKDWFIQRVKNQLD